MATGTDLRRMALALKGTTGGPHFDRAAFKVARIYVTLAADGRTANFKFTARTAIQVHDGARRLCADTERLGPARLDHGHLVQAQRGGTQERT